MLLFDRFELFGFPQTTYICDRKVQLKSLKHMITTLIPQHYYKIFFLST